MNRAKTRYGALLPTLLLTLFAAACGVDDGVSVDGEGNLLMEKTGTTVTILLTDAPADYIATAEVDIGRVELLPSDENGGGPMLLSEDGTDGFVNLLDFQGSATMQLAQADIEPGSFTQLRLIVEAARVSLIEGYTFRDGSTEKDLFVPSGAQTGIKLNLRDEDETEDFEIIPGETVLVLDFDVSQSFVLRGNPETPAGVHGVNFKPTIRVTARDVAASISGTVSSADEGVDVEGLTVRATPLDEGDVAGYQTEVGTALTAEDGSYTIYFLVPGDYEVTIDLDEGLASDPESRTVELGESENATDVDFEVMEVTGSISGTVSTSVDGATVEGLTVSALPDVEGAEAITTTTASDGTYIVESLVPGTYTVSVDAGEDLVTEPAEASVEVGADEDVTGIDFEIVEDVTGTISGAVTTMLGGASVEGLTVVATPAAEGADPVTAETDGDGLYTIESVQPGDYTVTVEVPETLMTNPASIDVTIEENEDEENVNFELLPSGQ